MDDSAKEALTQVKLAFAAETGPASYRCEEFGYFYESEGKEIAKALLDLDPIDVQAEDLTLHSDFLPIWASDAGLRWLIPGIIRAAFEDDNGEWILGDLYGELERRTSDDGMKLTEEQRQSIMQAHEAFYGTEEYNWNVAAHDAPFITRLRATDREPTSGQQGAEVKRGPRRQ